jgi:hypothetical protein
MARISGSSRATTRRSLSAKLFIPYFRTRTAGNGAPSAGREAVTAPGRPPIPGGQALPPQELNHLPQCPGAVANREFALRAHLATEILVTISNYPFARGG